MPLERSWVERIHTRMLVRYGSQWIGLYRDIDPELVIADWAAELNGFGATAITHAFQVLPDDAPPNAAQFARLCMRGPQSQAPALAWPPANPEVAALALASFKRPESINARQWAIDLREREQRGLQLTQAQREMLRGIAA